MPQLEVLYVSMLAEPGSVEHSACVAGADGVDDSKWFATRLAEAGLADQVHLSSVTIAGGGELPEPSSCSCVVIGGTFCGVSDGRPWQNALQSWLQTFRTLRRPLLGICGGHQAMAVALGGQVEKRTNGSLAGTADVALTEAGRSHALFADLGATPAFHFGNGDHVVEPPADTTVLARTSDSPCVSLDFGGRWYSTQFHPEASHVFFQTLVDAELVSLSAPPFRELATGTQLIANFIHLALKTRDDAGRR